MQPTGHQALKDDISELLFEVKQGEFGDYTNNKYPIPKMALRQKLIALAENVVNGKYDD